MDILSIVIGYVLLQTFIYIRNNISDKIKNKIPNIVNKFDNMCHEYTKVNKNNEHILINSTEKYSETENNSDVDDKDNDADNEEDEEDDENDGEDDGENECDEDEDEEDEEDGEDEGDGSDEENKELIVIKNITSIEEWFLSKNKFEKYFWVSISSLVYTIMINKFCNWNFKTESATGIIIGLLSDRLYHWKFNKFIDNKDITTIMLLYALPPSFLIVLRNFVDTYTIGLTLFQVSSIMLYFMECFGLCFSKIFHITKLVYPDNLKLSITWCILFIMCIIF